MTDPLEILLLGPFEVHAGGRQVPVSGSKRDALLAILAIHRGRVVDVDTLIAALWGEELPSSPRNAIQHHVTRLRAALGHAAIAASSDGYALTNATVDAVKFEELVGDARVALREGDARGAAEAASAALTLWRGSALHGLLETDWFTAEARRLEGLRIDALEEQFEAALALGEHRELVSALRATLDQHPFRERLWGQLMLALYRSGRQAEALETFQETRRVLAGELGLDPGPELRRLQESILAHDPAIAPVPIALRARGNLPAPSTSFVDRDEELATVVALLRDHRLVTLTGPPGVGTSRLALEAARSLEGEIRGGVWMIDLARVGGDEDVVRVVAQAVDARGADPLARVVARLRDDDAMLFFDGAEHVIAESGRIACALLAECPRLRVLAASRQILHVPGEVRFAVEPLPTDSATGEPPAVELFLERARAARPGFELSPDSAALVADISRRVDGLPLAIELVAARVNALGLHELLSIVDRRLDLLGERPASDAGRAALGTLVEWSYDVLHGDEKTLLHQLAVHRGGASLASLIAAGSTSGLDDGTVTYLLGALVDKSIVSVSFPGDSARYDLLDTVREYVLERLGAGGGLGAARKAHAEYFATLADEAWSELRGPRWLEWRSRLQLENDNLWAALEYAREAPDPVIAVRLGVGLGWYFTLAERVSEGRRFLELALAAGGDDPPAGPRLELLAFLCYLATEELDLEAAIAAGERALALATAETAPQAALAGAALALALAEAGEQKRAADLAARAHEMLGGAANDWTIAAASLLRASVAALAGDVDTVAVMAEEANRHSAAIGFDAFQVPALLLDAWVAERRDDGDAAEEAYRRAFDLAGRAGFADHASFALARLGAQALASGDLAHAEELERHALSAAEGAGASWTAAYARIELGRVLAASGEAETAAALLRDVLEWSERSRSHQARESLFIALAGDPAAAADAGLTRLAEQAGTPAGA
jgi:predicted ATPase